MWKLSRTEVALTFENAGEALREAGVLAFVFGLIERSWSDAHVGPPAAPLAVALLLWLVGAALAIIHSRRTHGSDSRRRRLRHRDRMGPLRHPQDQP
jgi:hypothetical protein